MLIYQPTWTTKILNKQLIMQKLNQKAHNELKLIKYRQGTMLHKHKTNAVKHRLTIVCITDNKK